MRYLLSGTHCHSNCLLVRESQITAVAVAVAVAVVVAAVVLVTLFVVFVDPQMLRMDLPAGGLALDLNEIAAAVEVDVAEEVQSPVLVQLEALGLRLLPRVVLLVGQVGVDVLQLEHEHDDRLEEGEREALEVHQIIFLCR